MKKWNFDKLMKLCDWDEEKFNRLVDKTAAKLRAAEKNEFWKQYNAWKRKCGE